MGNLWLPPDLGEDHQTLARASPIQVSLSMWTYWHAALVPQHADACISAMSAAASRLRVSTPDRPSTASITGRRRSGEGRARRSGEIRQGLQECGASGAVLGCS